MFKAAFGYVRVKIRHGEHESHISESDYEHRYQNKTNRMLG